MKLYKILMISTLMITPLFADEIMPDLIAESIATTAKLSRSEIDQEKKTFLDCITKYRSSEFVGHTQYVLSSLNLGLRANAKYSIETDGRIFFQLATAGNHYIANSDVTFPMQGSVYFEIKNNDGQLIDFKSESGETLSFGGIKNTFYIVENTNSFNLRKNVQSKFNKADRPIGRFLAIVKWDLFDQDIEFYEIQDSTGEKVLLRRGSFNGNVPQTKRSW
jgi:hypothetical protein